MAFQINPADLHVVGAALRTAATDAADSFNQHHNNLADLATTLLGASSAALTGKVETWRTTAATLTTNIQNHGTDLHTIAQTFQTHDETFSQAIRTTGTSLDLPEL